MVRLSALCVAFASIVSSIDLRGDHIEVGDVYAAYVYEPARVSTQNMIVTVGGACSATINMLAGYGGYRATETGVLYRNPAAWSNFAEMVYVDLPDGVGYTAPFGNSSRPLLDTIVADNIATFVRLIKPKFPHVKNIYLAGDTYAAHYIPLAISADSNLFAGSIIGHPLTDLSTFTSQIVPSLQTTSFIDAGVKDLENCSDALVGALAGYTLNTPTAQCTRLVLSVLGGQPLLATLAQSLYGDECGDRTAPTPDGLVDPCALRNAASYLKSAAGQREIGMIPKGRSFPETWNMCMQDFLTRVPAGEMRKSYSHFYKSTAATTGAGPVGRTFFYSGNGGMLPPPLATYTFMSLAAEYKSPFAENEWREIYYNTSDCQLAGYASVYRGDTTVATFRGSGMRVALDQPLRLYRAVDVWLQGDDTIGSIPPPTVPKTCGPYPTASNPNSDEELAAVRAVAEHQIAKVEAKDSARHVKKVAVEEGAAEKVAVPPTQTGRKPVVPPDSAPIPNSQYTGYVHVGGTDGVDGRHLFYWLFEADSSAAARQTDASVKPFADSDTPVVLWLQGGPGCSGLLGGFTENGPLQAVRDGANSTRLVPRRYPWTGFAHTLFLESPVCVGFSYVDGDQNLCTQMNDTITASDSLNFMLGFYAQFPELAKNPFYIAGESYAGHYVPQLTVAILDYNQKPNAERVATLDGDAAVAAAAAGGASPHIPLVAAIDGNPVTDVELGPMNDLMRWKYTPIIPARVADGIASACTNKMICGFQSGPCNMGTCSDREKKIYGISDTCWPWIKQVTPVQSLPGNIDFADPNTDMCPTTHPDYQGTSRTPYDPCTVNLITQYLNRPDVQKALGVVGSPTWGECSDPVNLGYRFADSFNSMRPLWQRIAKEANALIYSGDVDEIVATVGTAKWTRDIISEYWDNPQRVPWYSATNDVQMAGWVSSTKGITFATVRNAGHMVPTFQPLRSYNLISSFIAGDLKPLVNNTSPTSEDFYPFPGAAVVRMSNQ